MNLHRIIALFLQALPLTLLAQDDRQISLMRSVTDNVMNVCQAPSDRGKYWNIAIQGTGEAKVALKLANLGTTGRATFTKGEWNNVQGVLREQQAEDNKDYRECVEKLAPLFIEKFVPSPPPAVASTPQIAPLEKRSDTRLLPSAPPHSPREVIPRELTGILTLSKKNKIEVCLRIYEFSDGLPSKYYPVFHAWIQNGAVDVPMKLSSDPSCQSGYVLAGPMPSISRGGSMRIYDDSGPLDWVNVGNFAVEKGWGCEDVGLVESFVIKWKSNGVRERASDSGIPINGGYGWVCRDLSHP